MACFAATLDAANVRLPHFPRVVKQRIFRTADEIESEIVKTDLESDVHKVELIADSSVFKEPGFVSGPVDSGLDEEPMAEMALPPLKFASMAEAGQQMHAEAALKLTSEKYLSGTAMDAQMLSQMQKGFLQTADGVGSLKLTYLAIGLLAGFACISGVALALIMGGSDSGGAVPSGNTYSLYDEDDDDGDDGA